MAFLKKVSKMGSKSIGENDLFHSPLNSHLLLNYIFYLKKKEKLV